MGKEGGPSAEEMGIKEEAKRFTWKKDFAHDREAQDKAKEMTEKFPETAGKLGGAIDLAKEAIAVEKDEKEKKSMKWAIEVLEQIQKAFLEGK